MMSICPRVGGVADYLDRLRVNPLYTGFKEEVVKDPATMCRSWEIQRSSGFWLQLKEAA